MKNQKIVIFSILLLVTGFIAGSMFYKSSTEAQVEKIATSAANSAGAPLLRDHAPSFGKNQNNVTIVEFIDPQCEACKIFHPATKKIFFTYQNEIKVVYRYLANQRDSRFAVKILEASREQNKFNETLDVVFRHQAIWSGNPAQLWNFLPEAGLDMQKLRADFDKNDAKVDQILELDRSDARALSVRGTPTIFINGKALKNLNYKEYLELVEGEIYK